MISRHPPNGGPSKTPYCFLWKSDQFEVASANERTETASMSPVCWEFPQIGPVNFVEYAPCNFQVEQCSVSLIPSKMQPTTTQWCGVLLKNINLAVCELSCLYYDTACGTILAILASILIRLAGKKTVKNAISRDCQFLRNGVTVSRNLTALTVIISLTTILYMTSQSAADRLHIEQEYWQ